MINSILKELKSYACSSNAHFLPRFFKTGKGQYGEGDRFLGVTVPDTRRVAKKYVDASEKDIETLLLNPYHEVRLTALLILVYQYEASKDARQKNCIVDFYTTHRECINNWDLVDTSAYKILGDYLLTHDRKILYRFASTPHLWTQRIAIVSTYAFIRAGQFDDTLKLADIFLTHPHDLMQKAVGWMLREVGKRDTAVLQTFLHQHASRMPRTMLRYAIEKFDPEIRRRYLAIVPSGRRANSRS